MYKTILMPVDIYELELSEKAIRHAEYLAQSEGIIHLLHVLPDASAMLFRGYSSELRQFEQHILSEAKEKMNVIASHFTLPAERLVVDIRFGSVRDEVNEAAKAIDADVIVIGSRNPSITTHLLGSNAANVIRHTHVPVLVVR